MEATLDTRSFFPTYVRHSYTVSSVSTVNHPAAKFKISVLSCKDLGYHVQMFCIPQM